MQAFTVPDGAPKTSAIANENNRRRIPETHCYDARERFFDIRPQMPADLGEHPHMTLTARPMN